MIAAAKSGSLRQQLLFLYLTNANPSSKTTAWSYFDGTGKERRMTGDCDKPPYDSVVAAMQDGWRVIQVAQQQGPGLHAEHRTSYLQYEFVLERMMEV
jgi:hypothetical protein